MKGELQVNSTYPKTKLIVKWQVSSLLCKVGLSSNFDRDHFKSNLSREKHFIYKLILNSICILFVAIPFDDNGFQGPVVQNFVSLNDNLLSKWRLHGYFLLIKCENPLYLTFYQQKISVFVIFLFVNIKSLTNDVFNFEQLVPNL